MPQHVRGLRIRRHRCHMSLRPQEHGLPIEGLSQRRESQCVKATCPQPGWAVKHSPPVKNDVSHDRSGFPLTPKDTNRKEDSRNEPFWAGCLPYANHTLMHSSDRLTHARRQTPRHPGAAIRRDGCRVMHREISCCQGVCATMQQ
jgi:hypothetical protein